MAVAFAANSVTSLRVNCEFSDLENCVRNCYQCKVYNLIITKPNQTVVGINGLHKNSDDSENDVITLKIEDQVMRFLPSGFYNHFPYITVLKVWSSELSSIRQEDIRDMKYLTDLSLSDNNLESLDSNLFKYNLHLIKVDFTRNNIKNIGPNLLKPLRKLLFADFYQNYCISEGARYSFDDLNQKIRSSCPPTSEMMIAELDSLSNEVDQLQKEIEITHKKVKICEARKDDSMTLRSLFPTIYTNK